jgi:hypothetical protein
MSEQAGMPGELIYEHAVQIKRATEYGVALDSLLSGTAAPPRRERASTSTSRTMPLGDGVMLDGTLSRGATQRSGDARRA